MKLILASCLVVLGVLSAPAAEVLLDRASYVPGEPISVRFKGTPGNPKDWIGLYVEGKAAQDYFAWQYLDGTEAGNSIVVDGEVTFPKGAPEPGNYLVRILENDGYIVLEEVEFKVVIEPRVRSEGRTYRPGARVAVEFRYGPGNAKDWVGIYRPGGDDGSPIDWQYVDGTQDGKTGVKEGTLVFAGGFASPGDYEIRFFKDDSFDRLDVGRFVVEAVGPRVTIQPGDRQVDLAWEAVSSPAPVAKYRVLSGPGIAGPFTQVAETSGLVNRVTGLVNGMEYCFVVQAVSSTGETGPYSIPQLVSPYALGPDEFIAVRVASGTAGNLPFAGQLGVDFDVANPIRIEQLGAFDDGANGLRAEIRVFVFDRDSRKAVAAATFTSASPGVLRDGSRFKPLTPALDLPKGFRGSIVAEGYGPEEKAGTTATGGLKVSTGTGRGSVFLPGVARSGPPGEFPTGLEHAPGTFFAAGTFDYVTTPPQFPGKTRMAAIPGNGEVTLFWDEIRQPVPANRYKVLRRNVSGTFEPIAEIQRTVHNDSGLVNGTVEEYRIRAVASDSVEGIDSDTLAVTPNTPTAGVPYVVPENTAGNQAYGGSVGNDFDVVRPIRITHLGVFDDGGDGLKRTIKCRIYSRQTRQELALLVFDPASPGELKGGTRFKPLTQPLELAPGFAGTVVASGYGADERDGNRGAGQIEFTTFDGGSLRFVGLARWGDNPDAFPEIIDGGPADRYAAGNFMFEPVSSAPRIAVVRQPSGALVVDWFGLGFLSRATSLDGPWTLVPESGGRLSDQGVEPTGFYQLRTKP
ncbi:MAG: fibronectin type III domain-containing protein [Verrucomicrobia bacterium]|nr:fibronectin type III domain-containing protein [Verrucomicrobiota bacterium]